MNDKEVFWDEYSSDFDSIYGIKNSLFNIIINRLFRETMRIRFEKTIRMIPEEEVSVLDIGCGPGHYCFALAKNGSRKILGIDFSERMIELSRKHAAEMRIGNNLEFKVQNILDFVTQDKYDYVIMMGFIEYFESPVIILKKAVSLAQVSVFISFPAKGGILAFQRKLRYKRKCFLRFYNYDDIRNLLQECNIKHFKIERIRRDFFVSININQK